MRRAHEEGILAQMALADRFFRKKRLKLCIRHFLRAETTVVRSDTTDMLPLTTFLTTRFYMLCGSRFTARREATERRRHEHLVRKDMLRSNRRALLSRECLEREGRGRIVDVEFWVEPAFSPSFTLKVSAAEFNSLTLVTAMSYQNDKIQPNQCPPKASIKGKVAYHRCC